MKRNFSAEIHSTFGTDFSGFLLDATNGDDDDDDVDDGDDDDVDNDADDGDSDNDGS